MGSVFQASLFTCRVSYGPLSIRSSRLSTLWPKTSLSTWCLPWSRFVTLTGYSDLFSDLFPVQFQDQHFTHSLIHTKESPKPVSQWISCLNTRYKMWDTSLSLSTCHILRRWRSWCHNSLSHILWSNSFSLRSIPLSEIPLLKLLIHIILLLPLLLLPSILIPSTSFSANENLWSPLFFNFFVHPGTVCHTWDAVVWCILLHPLPPSFLLRDRVQPTTRFLRWERRPPRSVSPAVSRNLPRLQGLSVSGQCLGCFHCYHWHPRWVIPVAHTGFVFWRRTKKEGKGRYSKIIWRETIKVAIRFWGYFFLLNSLTSKQFNSSLFITQVRVPFY